MKDNYWRNDPIKDKPDHENNKHCHTQGKEEGSNVVGIINMSFLGDGSQGSTKGEEIQIEEHASLDAREGYANQTAIAL